MVLSRSGRKVLVYVSSITNKKYIFFLNCQTYTSLILIIPDLCLITT
jgi:hypothetical protein